MAEKHVKVKAFDCPYKVLRNVSIIYDFLVRMIERIGMRPLGKPIVYDIHEELKANGLVPDPDEPEGVSGVCVLSTSHVAIGTWPHRGYAVIDVYSCRDFDSKVVEDTTKELLEAGMVVVDDLSESLEGLDDLPIINPPD